MRAFLIAGLLLAATPALSPPALALSSAPYVAPGAYDPARLLPPPPAPGSAAEQVDLAELHADQARRTPDIAAHVEADANLSLYLFRDVLGPQLARETVPVTDRFFAKLTREGNDILTNAKEIWKRPRPFVRDPLLSPPGNLRASVTRGDGTVTWSYPSGHTTYGALSAIILSRMVPEKRAELYARGWDIGDDRPIAGVHYPSDVAAGRINASIIAILMLQNPAFRADLAAATRELRAALGLPALDRSAFTQN